MSSNKWKAQCVEASKKSAMSASTTQRSPAFSCRQMRRMAMCVDRPGRKPKLSSRKVGSKIGSKTLTSACWQTRSMTVGMPSGRLAVDPGFSISTRRTGRGW